LIFIEKKTIKDPENLLGEFLQEDVIHAEENLVVFLLQ
jgi:hypothetical protein